MVLFAKAWYNQHVAPDGIKCMGIVGVSWVPGPLGQHVLIDIRECKQDYSVSRPPAVQGG